MDDDEKTELTIDLAAAPLLSHSAEVPSTALHIRTAPKALKRIEIRRPLACPYCNVDHVDEGEWSVRPHHTHLCAACGKEWEVHVFGVARLSIE